MPSREIFAAGQNSNLSASDLLFVDVYHLMDDKSKQVKLMWTPEALSRIKHSN